VVTPKTVVLAIIFLPCSRDRETLVNKYSGWSRGLVRNVGWVEDEEGALHSLLFPHSLDAEGVETGDNSEVVWRVYTGAVKRCHWNWTRVK
jgi:hypothetical protein